MSDNRLVTLNEVAEITRFSKSWLMVLKRYSGNFPEPAAKLYTGDRGKPQHQFLLQDILIWAEPYHREGVNTRTKRGYTKKPSNAAQVEIENSSFNRMAKEFITRR